MSDNNFIYGSRTIIEAIKSGKKIDRILLKQGENSPLMNELINEAKKGNINIQFVPSEKLEKIKCKNHQGAVAYLAAVEYKEFETLLDEILQKKESPLILILDGVSDVRNFGAICRTAECAGVDAVIVPSKGAAALNADAMKTSAGALNHLPVGRTGSLKNTIKLLQASGFSVIVASEKTEKSYFEADFTGPIAIVMGSEDKGASVDVLKTADQMVRIPIQGQIASLNVSVAAGIVIYEAIRQRIQ